MVQEAQHSASEDNRRRETVQARNEADQAIYQAEKSLSNMGEQVSAMDRGKIEAEISTLKQAMPGEDSGRIRAQIAELQQAMMVLGQAVNSGATETEPGNDGHAEPHSDNVTEGEFREI